MQQNQTAHKWQVPVVVLYGNFLSVVWAASLCGFLEVCNEVSSVILLLQTSKDHFGARDVFLGVLQVDPQCVSTPCDTFVLICIRVGEAWGLTSFATN